MALLTGGAVGDIAHRIDRFVGRARGDEHANTGERPRTARKLRLNSGDDFEWFRHSSDAGFAAFRHLAGVGPDQNNLISRELSQVSPRRLVAPHQRVHGGRQQYCLVGGEQDGRGEVIRQSVRHLRHQIGGGGRHHDQARIAGEPDMADVELGARVEQIRKRMLAGDRADRQRRAELLRRRRHHHAHLDAALAQSPDQIERFVGRDAAADDEQDVWGIRLGAAPGPVLSFARRIDGRCKSIRVGGGAAQDGAHLILDRTAVLGCAKPQ